MFVGRLAAVMLIGSLRVADVTRLFICFCFFFFQAEDGIRDAQESRGLGDVYKRQGVSCAKCWWASVNPRPSPRAWANTSLRSVGRCRYCLLYTSDAADDLLCVDLGGRRIIKKKKKLTQTTQT